LAEAKRKLAFGASANTNQTESTESILAEKEAEIMSLRAEVKTVSDDLKKAQALIGETRASFAQVFTPF